MFLTSADDHPASALISGLFRRLSGDGAICLGRITIACPPEQASKPSRTARLVLVKCASQLYCSDVKRSVIEQGANGVAASPGLEQPLPGANSLARQHLPQK